MYCIHRYRKLVCKHICSETITISNIHIFTRVRVVNILICAFTSLVTSNTHWYCHLTMHHYSDIIMSTMASQITSLVIVYSTVYSGAKIKESIKALRHWPLCREFYHWPVISPHKWPVTWKLFPFYDIVMSYLPIQLFHHLSWTIILQYH